LGDYGSLHNCVVWMCEKHCQAMLWQADTLQHDVVVYSVDVLSLLLVVSYTQCKPSIY